MKIKITADSTCDLSQELVEKYNIGISPLHVALGDNDFHDGVTIVPQDIYNYYNECKKLPKSGSCSVVEYQEFFQKQLDEGYDAVVHFNLSSEMSASHNNAVSAAQNLQNVYVVDSRNLSTGTGLLVLHACDLANEGIAPQEIVDKVNARVDAVRASFIINTLEYLHKGGRCSSLVYYAANLMGLKPVIEVKSGKMGVGNKFIGKFDRCVKKYADLIKSKCTSPDKRRCFVTHTQMDDTLVAEIIDKVKSWGYFDEVIETTAGCTITTHCGPNTIGILYINDGENIN